MQRNTHTHARPTPCPRPGNSCNGFYSASSCASTTPLVGGFAWPCTKHVSVCWAQGILEPQPESLSADENHFPKRLPDPARAWTLSRRSCSLRLIHRKTFRTADGFFLQELVRCFFERRQNGTTLCDICWSAERGRELHFSVDVIVEERAEMFRPLHGSDFVTNRANILKGFCQLSWEEFTNVGL